MVEASKAGRHVPRGEVPLHPHQAAPQAEAVAQTTSTEAPATAEAPATDNNKAEDILAMIRNRQG